MIKIFDHLYLGTRADYLNQEACAKAGITWAHAYAEDHEYNREREAKRRPPTPWLKQVYTYCFPLDMTDYWYRYFVRDASVLFESLVQNGEKILVFCDLGSPMPVHVVTHYIAQKNNISFSEAKALFQKLPNASKFSFDLQGFLDAKKKEK